MAQRPAKTYRAAAGTDGRISLFEVMEFMETAQHVLENAGESDAAFYFEQVHEHLKRNPQTGFKEKVTRILGV